MKPTRFQYLCQIYSGIVAALTFFSAAVLVGSYGIRLTPLNASIFDRVGYIAVLGNFAAVLLGCGIIALGVWLKALRLNGVAKMTCLALIMLISSIFLLPAIAFA